MKDKLDTTYTLTVRPEYASLIPLVAKMNGWDSEGDPKEFLSMLTNMVIKRTMSDMIKGALEQYYGQSQAPLITQAMLDYEDSAQLNSVWSEVEE